MSQEANRGCGGQRGRVQPRRPPIRRPMMDARQYRAQYQLQRFQDCDDQDLDMMVSRRPPSPIRPAVAREVAVEPDVIPLTSDDDIPNDTIPSSPRSSHTPSTPSDLSTARLGPGEPSNRPMQDYRDV